MSDRMKKELSININTSVNTQPIKSAEKELNSFFTKYDNQSIELGIDQKNLKIDTKDFYKAVTAAKQLEDSINGVSKSAPLMMKALNKDIEFANNVKAEFKDVMATFDDGSIVHGFDDIANKISKGFAVVAVDLGGRVQYLKEQISNAVNDLEFDGIEKFWNGTINFSSGNMDKGQIQDRIELLKKLFDYQEELERFKGAKFTDKDAPLGTTTGTGSHYIKQLEKDYHDLEEYNLRTTEQLKRRRKLIAEAESVYWDEDSQKDAKSNIKDDEAYRSAIDSLEWYIQERKNAIEELEANENELFSVDGISKYVESANTEIERLQGCMKELQTLRDGPADTPIVGNLTEVLSALEKIESAIREVTIAFKPLTDALSSEDSAISQMVNANIADLQRLQSEVAETFANIKTISEKDFSSKTTNVVQQTINAPGGILKTQRAELKELAKMLAQYQSAIGNLNSKSSIFKKIGLSAAGQLDFFSFDLNEVLAGLKKATTADKLDGWADVLEDYKKGIIRVANEINKIQSDLVNLDPLQNQKKKDPDIINLGQTSANVDGILTEVKSIRDQIDAEIQGIRASFEDIFKFDSLNPNLDNITSITDQIYQQFSDLQSKVKALDFDIDIPAVVTSVKSDESGIVDAANAISQEGNEAEKAASKKQNFVTANKQVADSGEKTAQAAKEAADGIEQEAKAAQEAAKILNNVDGVSTSAKDISEKYKSSGRVWDDLSRTTLEQRSKLIADSFNKYIATAGISVSNIDTSFLDKSYKTDDGSTGLYEVVKLVAKGTNAFGEIVTITHEYNMASAALEKESTKFHDAVNKFNLETAKSTADSQVKALRNQMGSFKIDLSELTTAQAGIVNEESFDVFNEKLKNAQQRLTELKAKLKSVHSLDPIANTESTMSNLDVIVKTYQENIKKFANVDGYKDLETSLTNINNKLKEFNDAKAEGNGNKMASAVADINKEIVAYNANLKLITARYQENNRIAKESAKEEKKRIAEENAAWDEYNKQKEAEAKKERETNLAFEAKAAKEAADAEKELAQARKEANDFYEQEEKTRKAQEEQAWKEYRAEQEAAAEKERQINLAFVAKEAQEAAEAERELAQARKEANDYFDAVEKQEKKDEETKKVKELNALYRERNTIITALIKYNNKANTLKTDKAIQRAKDQLELEKQRLAAIDDEIDKYGELINQSKLEQQNDRLTSRLRDSNVTNYIATEQKQDIETVNHLLQRRKDTYDKIFKLKQQMSAASGDEERQAIQKELDNQNTLYRVLTKQLNTYKDIALQRKVTEQDNQFREQDNWNKSQQKIKSAADTDNAELESQKQDYKDILNLVEQLFDAQTALHKINLDSTGKVHTAEREKEIEKVKELSMLLKDIYGIDIKNLSSSLNKNGLLIQEQKNKLLEKERGYKQEIVDLTAKVADQEATVQKKLQEKENKKNQNYGKLEFNQATKFFESMNANVRNLGGTDSIGQSLKTLVQDYTGAYKKIALIRKQFEEDPNATKDDGLKAKFQDAVLHASNLKKEIQTVFKETQKLEGISDDLRLGEAISLDELDPGDIKSSMAAYANAVADGRVEIKGFNEAGTEMYGVIDKGSGAISSFAVAFDQGTNKLHAFTTETKKASNEWEDFKTQAISGGKNLIEMYVGFQEAVQAVKTGVNYVKEIDLAMTELKKVTDETDGSYKQFLSDAGSTSATIGSTISDFTEATATFARLGYSMEESSSMAETAIIYKNVADGLDTVEESSESIISTMMAFGIEATDTMSIIDRFNAVGNNFAITSAGIGEALQRSASALFSAGNTIDESVALVTAANSVIQNPEQVGTALKTLALRLRGAKVELEEAGLETDNMAESTSTLQAKLKALTHGKVDIMLDADTFKSTTQILREMSEAWEDMTDIERASALELMGGKRQANILSSVITNFETVEDVIETSMNSSGSAIAENEKWLDSIEGKTYQFTNALQTMWSNMIDSETVKGFLDFGTDVIQFLDTSAGKIIAFVGALKLAAKFKGFSIKGIAKGLGDTINQITTAQQTLQSLSQTTKLGDGYDFTNVNAYAQAVANLTAKQQANLLASQGLNQEQIRYALTLNQVDDASTREAMAHVHAASAKEQEAASGSKLIQQKAVEVAASLKIQAAKDGEARSTELNAAADILENSTSESLTAAKLTEAMTSQNVSAATQAEIFAKLGLTNANKGLAASIKALYVVNPVGFWVTVISTILSLIPLIGELADAFTTSNEEIQEAANQAKSAIESISSEFKENEKFVSSNAKRFAELAQGVDMLSGKNLSLSADDYEEFLSLSNQLAEVFPTLSRNYDENGNAIVQLSGDANTMVSSLENLLDVQRQMAQQKIVDNIPDLYAGVKQQSDAYRTEIGTFESNIKRYQNLLDSLKENDMTSIINSLFSTRKLQYDGSAQSTMLVENIKNILDNLEIKTLLNESIDGNGDITGYTLELLSSNSAEQLQDAKNRISVGIDAVAKEYNEKMNELNSDIQKTTNENKANWSSLSASIFAWTQTDPGFKLLNDNMQSMVQTVINNLDYSSLSFKDWEEAQDFISDNIISLFSGDMGEQVSQELTDMFDLQSKFKSGDMGIDDYKTQLQEYVKFVQEDLGVDKKVQDNLLKMFGLDPDAIDLEKGAMHLGENIQEMYNHAAKLVTEGNEGLLSGLTYDDLQILFQVDANTTPAVSKISDLKKMIKDKKIELTTDFTVANYADYAEDIGKVSSNIATYKEALENLGSGSFTMEDFVELIAQFPELADGVDVASGEFKGLAKNLAKAAKNAPDDLVDDLKDLKQELSDAGKETDAIDNLIKSLEDMPDDALDGALDKYGELIDVINAAKAAQEALNAAMSLNPNEGFETRGSAIDQMKKLMEQGMIGSESELWDIAEAYGFTYESANSIEQNADALYEFITAREKWYKTDKDGNYTFDGTEDFIESAENAINSDKFKTALQKALGKEGDESFNVADYIKWDYEDGVLDFDFDNENWDAIVKALGETSELAGLTSEEFKDLLTQIGMFFDVNWQDASDVSSHIAKIAEGSGTTEEKIKDMKNAVEAFIKESEGVELDLDDPNANISDFSKEIQDLIKQYLELKDEVLSSEKNFDNANKKLKELGKTDIDFNADTTDIEDLNSQIEEAQKVLNEFKDSDGNIDISADGAEEAQLILKKLLRQKQLLEQPAVMKVKVADDGSNIDQTIQKVQEFKNAYDKLELEIAIGGDVDSAQEEVDRIQEELKGMDADILAKINIDPSASAETINAQIMAISPEVLAKLKLDTSAIDSYSPPNKEADAKYKVDSSEVDSWSPPVKYGTVIYKTGGGSADGLNNPKWVHTTGGGRLTMANGTVHTQGAAYKSGSFGARKTETSLIGELGPELLVRDGMWTTIGDGGAEFVNIKKGDIIFNHKQTKSLLENGYVTGRGRAYAEGTAFASGNSKFKKYKFSDTSGSEIGNASNKLSKAAKDISNASEEFAEVFDWIEVRLEEINERIDLKSAKLDNAVGSKKQNGIIDDIIDLNRDLYDNLKSGASKYNSYAKQLLNNIPAEYRKAAQDGSIAIESFTGEVGEKTLKAIEEYRDWVQKGADATQQAEEVLAEIAALAKEAFDNIVKEYDNKTSIQDSKNDQYEAHNEYIKTDQGTESEAIYQAQIKENNKKINTLGEKRNKMQAELDKRVESGEIKKYSDDWYDAVNEIAAVDTEIINLKTDNENLQDTVNDLHWENFDNLMGRIESVSDEAENLVDILGTKDLFDKDTGEWTDEGVASLGLYAQQMENAEMQAKKYEEEIDYLNKNWQALGYTEQEYLEKLDELKDGQYDAIKAYNDSKDAIVDLNKERVDAIKNGIEKEIEAYEELIEKKQEELDAEKDLYDFQKNINNQQKEISNVERKLAALEGDNSASARAQRAKLQAELAELQQELQDTYYERSVSDQQEALDKELENFQKEKEKEIEGWDEYLENTETVVSDSLAVVQANTSAVYTTLDKMGKEYSLSISEALTSPWKNGEKAIQSYSEKFGLAASSTVDKLNDIEKDYKKTMSNIEKSGKQAAKQVDDNSKKYTSATKNGSSSKKTESKKEIKVGGKINAGSAKIYSSTSDKTGSKQKYSSDPIYKVLEVNGSWVKVRHHKLSKGITGWFKKSQVQAYAKGTKGVKNDQLALIDELGEELVIRPSGGRMTFLEKGSGVVPADLTTNLMEWGKLDPSVMLDQNRPKIEASPSICNTEFNITMDIAEVVHIDQVDQDNIPDLTKAVEKQLDKYMKNLNAQIRRYARR